jgi:phosphoribosylamine--glycine ligase
MNVLIIGSGGREHAFAWKIRESGLCKTLYVAPGNAGTAEVAQNVPIQMDDLPALGRFCHEHAVDLVLVGPEAPLVAGIRDYFESQESLKHILFVGPGSAGAQLEGSKDFSKKFMLKHGIPTAKAQAFDTKQVDQAKAYIDTCKPPIVLKADGLAAGKGVIICLSKQEAKTALHDMLVNRRFGSASEKVLIEEFLNGIELSVFVLTDGKNYVILPEAKDYKRIGDGDQGPNTGGMGAVSPVPFATASFMQKVEESVVKPTIRGLAADGIPYKGFIFIGLMNVGGTPFVIEYNVRMGDPETQAVLPRIKTDLLELLRKAASGELAHTALSVDDSHAVTVVMVSGGYPNEYAKGKIINGLHPQNAALVFHAGSKKEAGNVLTDGGRVLAVTGRGRSISQAREKAYEAVTAIQWDDHYYRKDIGSDLLNL